MTAPRRLLDGGGSLVGGDAELGRQLLEDALDVAPPPGAQAVVWAGLEAMLAGPPGGGPSGGSTPGQGGPGQGGPGYGGQGAPGVSHSLRPASPVSGSGAPIVGGPLATAPSATAPLATTAGLTLGAKVGVAAALASVIVGLAVLAGPFPLTSGSTDPHAPTIVAEPPDALLGVAPSARSYLPDLSQPGEGQPREGQPREEAGREREAIDARLNGSAARAGRTAEPVERATGESGASLLQREADGLRRARSELASGNGRAALVVLGEIDRDVPRGVLGQERALVMIEALAATGQSAQASRHAEAFLAAAPDSPHAARVRRFVRP